MGRVTFFEYYHIIEYFPHKAKCWIKCNYGHERDTNVIDISLEGLI